MNVTAEEYALIENEMYISLLKQTIEEKGEIQLTVHGNSMLPLISDGDKVKIKKCSEYHIGDVVAYFMVSESKLRIIIHRVIFKRPNYLLTKGDNNNFIDKIRVEESSILGVALLE